jgi:hypothetical protein
MPLALLAPGDLIINSWVFSALLQSGDQHGHNIYDPSQSSTYQELTGSVWSIAYGDDISAPGLVRIDTVTVRSTTAQSQAIELASQVSSSFVSDVSSDGLLGLAFNNINTGMFTAIYTESGLALYLRELIEIFSLTSQPCTAIDILRDIGC